MGNGAVIRPQALMLLCEFVLNSTRAPPNEAFLYHTLLQLYLADRLSDDEADGEASTSQTKRRCNPFAFLKLLVSLSQFGFTTLQST